MALIQGFQREWLCRELACNASKNEYAKLKRKCGVFDKQEGDCPLRCSEGQYSEAVGKGLIVGRSSELRLSEKNIEVETEQMQCF